MMLVYRTDCCFSPDDKMVMTGTSLNRGEKEGKLVFLERNSLDRVMESRVSDSVSSYSVMNYYPCCVEVD